MNTISKLEAARRQLDCAIRLYLNEDDLAAVQTLAWSALTVLRDLAKHKKVPIASPPDRAYYDFDRKAAAFLKHADRDPDAWLFEIDHFIPEFVFHEAIPLYCALGGEVTKEMLAARTIIDMKYGFDRRYERSSERQREEDRERERATDRLDADEQEKAIKEFERDKRSRQRGLLALGRSMLTGKPLFS